MKRLTIEHATILATMSAIVFFFLLITAAHAQSGFVPLQDVTGSKLSGLYNATSLGDFINKVFFFTVALGAILVVGRLAYAGWLYMVGDNVGNKRKAKDVIGDVVIGLLLLLSIWLILNQINPDILNLDILRSIRG